MQPGEPDDPGELDDPGEVNDPGELDLFRRLVEVTPNAVFVDVGDRIAFVNPAGVALYGAGSAGDLVGRRLVDLVPPQDAAAMAERARRVAAGIPVAPVATERILRFDGTVRVVEVKVAPVTYGGVPALLSLLSDVTDKAAADAELARRARRDEVVTSTSLLLAAAGEDELDGAITEALRRLAAVEDVDRTYVQVFNDDLSLVFTTHEWAAAGVRRHIDAVQGFRTSRFAYSFAKLARLEPWHEPDLAAAPAPAAPERTSFAPFGVRSILQVPMEVQGRLYGLIGFNLTRSTRRWDEATIQLLRAVGEVVATAMVRRRAAEEVRVARDEAERANRAKSEFLARMSHELRTPLNAILGFAELLAADERTEEEADYLGHVLSAGRHLLGLVEEVLDLSRIEAGRLAVRAERVDLAGAATTVAALLAPAALPRRVSVRVDPALSGLAARADRQRVVQVLANLVSNAVKYNHPGGSVTITGGLDADLVTVEVIDTGIGIPEGVQHRLFEPFDRLGHEGSGIEGTGIGLVVTRRLVEVMDGAMWVSSAPGHGTRVTVALPAASDGAGDVAPTLVRDASRVLLADPDEQHRRGFAALLRDEPGTHSLTAAGPDECLELVRSWHPDLVLLDADTPSFASEAFVARLRHVERHDTPIAFVGDRLEPRTIERSVRLGAVAVLARPLTAGALGSLLRAAS